MAEFGLNLGLLEFLLAVLTAVVGFGIWLIDRHAERRSYRETTDARDTERIRYDHSLRLQSADLLTAWAGKGARVMSRADHFLAMKDQLTAEEATRLQFEIASELSFLVDEGRWLFPNWHREQYGTAKHQLNQGYRDARISPLVRCYERVMGAKKIDPHSQRKTFVRQIQEMALPLAERVPPKDESTME